MHLSEGEKRIYNEYLKASRKGKPYKLRQNFDKLDDETYVNLKKLGMFFNTFPHINMRNYFAAGFAENQFQKLSFFKTLRATKLYNVYMAENLNDADSEWVKDFVRDSFVFIYLFCRKNKIKPADYLDHMTPAGYPSFFLHLKEFKVCVYVLLGFEQFETKLFKYFDDVEDVIITTEFTKNLPHYRVTFFASKTCKTLVREGLKAITKPQTTKHTNE